EWFGLQARFRPVWIKVFSSLFGINFSNDLSQSLRRFALVRHSAPPAHLIISAWTFLAEKLRLSCCNINREPEKPLAPRCILAVKIQVFPRGIKLVDQTCNIQGFPGFRHFNSLKEYPIQRFSGADV